MESGPSLVWVREKLTSATGVFSYYDIYRQVRGWLISTETELDELIIPLFYTQQPEIVYEYVMIFIVIITKIYKIYIK